MPQQEDTNNPHPIPRTPATPPPNRPGGQPRPRGDVSGLLLPEYGDGITPHDRERNAVINEQYYPEAAIVARCVAAGYPYERTPANAA
jgi:hypothetical protein